MPRNTRLGRHAGRKVAINDYRSPMRRLLEDCSIVSSGMIEPEYDQQFRTLFKAIRLGYVDNDTRALTSKGYEFLKSNAR